MFAQTKYKFFIEAPFEISTQCCNILKKSPAHRYERKTKRMPITAQTASESRLRTQKWLKNGCNGFNMKAPISNPMSFWTEQDILWYIRLNNLPICSVYGDILTDEEEERLVKDASPEHIKEYLISRLKTIFPCVSNNPRIFKNSKNSPMFLFCFAISNESVAAQRLALRIADHILKKK